MNKITLYRFLNDYNEVIDWCKEHFHGGENGRYDVFTNGTNRVIVCLTPFTKEAATLIALKWL